MKKIKRRSLSWLLVIAMVLSGLALPEGRKAKAAETSYDLTVGKGQSPVTMEKDQYGSQYISQYIADTVFNVPDAVSSKEKIRSGGARVEVTIKINSISNDTGSTDVMIFTQDNTWNWNNSEAAKISAGKEITLNYDLTQMTWNGSTLKKIGIRFADDAVNTSSISYSITSAKVFVSDSSSSGGSTGGSTGGTTDDGLDADAKEDQSKYSASLTKLSSSSDTWHEYSIMITNHTSSAISKVQVVIPASEELKDFQSWNLSVTYNKTVGGYIVYYAGEIAANSSVTPNAGNGEKIGFVPSSVTLGQPYVRAINCDPPQGEGTSSGELNYEITGQTKDIPLSQTPVGKHGKLHLKKVEGYGNAPVIVDKNDNPYQLRGASSHGLNFGDVNGYANKGSLQSLRDEWGVNMFRLASYVTQYNGYTVGGKDLLDSKIEEGVQAATDLGMYVIVDWHIHAENPHDTKSWAKDFFTKYATKYKDYDNVIFEICNEPKDVQWYTGNGDDLYSYCKEIAGIIRDCGSDALIVCGTNTWSQDVEDVAKKPLKDDGFEDILYTFHFYSGSHYADKMAKVKKATADGTPIFVTEFGICDASGNGGFDTANADAWIELCDSYNISYACWSLCNKGESASYLKTSCSKTTGGYVASDLATTGIWLINTYRAHQDIEEETDTKVTPKPSSGATAKPGASASAGASSKPGASASAAPSSSAGASSKPGASASAAPSSSAGASSKPGTSASATPTSTAGTSSKPGTSAAPGESADPTPGSSDAPQPGESVSPAPGSSESPQPGESVSPAPGSSESPQPGESVNPAPGSSESPQPGESVSPAPGSSESPQPGESVSPVPGSSENPKPGVSGSPAPGSSERPKPGASGSPTPGGTTSNGASSGGMTQSPSAVGSEAADNDGQNGKLRLAKRTLKIKRGKKKRIVIKAKAAGDKVKCYKVIGKKIVRVNAKGVVKARKKGKTTIRVIMKSGASAKCKVIVKK